MTPAQPRRTIAGGPKNGIGKPGRRLVVFIGLAIYLIYYVAKKDRTVYLTVQPDGTVKAGGFPIMEE